MTTQRAGINSAYYDRVATEIDHNISTAGYIILSAFSFGIGGILGLLIGLYVGEM